MRELLHEVVERGQPAQSDAAARILERLDADPDDPGARADAQGLVDAYLHDPYLTRYRDPKAPTPPPSTDPHRK